MKKISFFLLIVLLLASCEHLAVPGEGDLDLAPKQTVTILTRSSTNDIQYPLYVYAFTEGGKCAASQMLASSNDDLSLALRSGIYRIVAISNTDGYTLPTSPTLTSIIKMSESNNYALSPLQMAQADVTVGSTSQSLNLTLAYKVANLSFTLNSVPESVTSVSVTISQQNSAIVMNGEYSETKSTIVNLDKSGSTWFINNICVFPGSSAQTVFTFTLKSADGTVSYGYNYSSPLAASTPYNITGTYSEGTLNLVGTFIYEGWKAPVKLDFSFGPGSVQNDTPSTDNDIPAYSVSSFPKAGTLWNDHIVAYAYTDDGSDLRLSDEAADSFESVNILLLSRQEWTKVPSATNYNASQLRDKVTGYSEDDLSAWSIPTREEAQELISLYNENNLTAFNSFLSSNKLATINFEDDGKNIRFLCNEGNTTFAWKSNATLGAAGGTVLYSLRLVKHVKIEKK